MSPDSSNLDDQPLATASAFHYTLPTPFRPHTSATATMSTNESTTNAFLHEVSVVDDTNGGEVSSSSPSQVASSNSSGPTAIPAEDGDVALGKSAENDDGDAAANGENDAAVNGEDGADNYNNSNEEEGGQDRGDDGDDDDESEYSYTYDEEDDGHYSGFLIPTDPFDNNRSVEDGSGAAAASSSAAAAGVGTTSANVVDAMDAEESNNNTATISRAASGLSSSSTTNVPEMNPSERKQKWKEPTRAAVNMSLRAEKESKGGRRRLASDLYKIMMADTDEAGFSLEPCDEDSMDKWCIKLFGFDCDSHLAKDLMVVGMDHVELEMSFPDDCE